MVVSLKSCRKSSETVLFGLARAHVKTGSRSTSSYSSGLLLHVDTGGTVFELKLIAFFATIEALGRPSLGIEYSLCAQQCKSGLPCNLGTGNLSVAYYKGKEFMVEPFDHRIFR